MNSRFAFLRPISEQDTGLWNRHKAPEPRESAHTGVRNIPAILQAGGNLAVQQLFRSGAVQANLAISHPGDPEEREADRVADQVISSALTGTIQRKCATCAEGTTCPKCEEEEKIQPKEKPGHGPQATPPVHLQIASSRGGGSPLPPSTRASMEPRFGANFSGVRLHMGGQAVQLNRAISAQAFTHGRDIYLGDGKDNIESSAGKRLLAHELTHVIQQSRQGGSQLQRTCSQSAEESFYQTAGNYCKDTGFSGALHPGQRCYREVPRRSSYWECPPGDQVCFDKEGKCHDSYDRASTVEGKDSDGTCNLHGLCFSKHAFLDIIPGVLQEGADEQAREHVECMDSCKNLDGFAKSLCEVECRRSSRVIP